MVVPALCKVLFRGDSRILPSIRATKSEILAEPVPMGTMQTSARQKIFGIRIIINFGTVDNFSLSFLRSFLQPQGGETYCLHPMYLNSQNMN